MERRAKSESEELMSALRVREDCERRSQEGVEIHHNFEEAMVIRL